MQFKMLDFHAYDFLLHNTGQYQNVHKQVAAFFYHNGDTADAKVGKTASNSPGASQRAKLAGGQKHVLRKQKEHYEYVVKRSLQRARKRAHATEATM